MKSKVLLLEGKEFYKNIISEEWFLNCDICYLSSFSKVTSEFILSFDYVGYTVYSSPLYHSVIELSRSLNVGTILFMDGICEFSNFECNPMISKFGIDNYHPVVSDFIFVVGYRAERYFTLMGVEPVCYVPKRVYDIEMEIHPTAIRKSANQRVLITTANTAYYNEEEFESLVDLLLELVANLEREGLNYCYRIFDVRLLGCIPKAPNIIDCDFSKCLDQIDSVITTPSSIAIESIMRDLPTGLLIYRDSPLFIQAGWLIHKGINFQSTLNSMLKREKKRMIFQRSEVAFCDDYSSRQVNFDVFKRRSEPSENEIKAFSETMKDNLLLSRFNFNFEHFFRSLYVKAKSKGMFKKLFKMLRG